MNKMGMKARLRPERQKRFFKAQAIKFNRKLDRMGEKALEPENFSRLMIEGKALLTFAAIDAMNRNRK